MKAHPTMDDLARDPVEPDVRRHLDHCPKCRVERRILVQYQAPPVEDLPFDRRYRLGDPIGQGPRTTAYQAFDMQLERYVALKRLSGPVDLDSLQALRAALDHVEHPSVARILDVPDVDPPTFTRAWLDGRDLTSLATAPAPIRLASLCQLASGLASLHAAGIAHGALHAGNVRITSTGRTVLVDAGIGAPLTGPERAPELTGPLERSPAADWYAVGVLFRDGPLPELTARLRSRDPAARPGGPEVLSALLLERDGSAEVSGRYQSQSVLGRGGMGVVHRVRDPQLNRPVALKSLLPELDSEHAVRRFRAEAQVTAQLQHPGIIPVHDAGVLPDGRPFFTMKQVAGRTLFAVLNQASTDPTWTLGRGVEILLRASEAVAYAHSRGVVHRDLKPANVMVGDFGEVLVLDWGLAGLLGEAQASRVEVAAPHPGDSRPGSGTPGYMPPEQASGAVAADPRMDVFALGVILREILDTDESPRDLHAVADKATRTDPAGRYPDAAAFAQELEAWRSGAPVQAYTYDLVERTGRRLRPFQAPLLVAAVAAAVATVLGGVGVTQLVTTQRASRDHLAQSLVDRANLALAAGDRIPAEVYASGAIALADRPEARGVLARLGRAPYPTRSVHHAVPCDSLVVTGETAICGAGSGTAALDRGGIRWAGPGGRVWPGPDGHILIEEGGTLSAADLASGATRRLADLAEPLVGVAAVGGELVVASASDVRVVDGTHRDERIPRVAVVEMVPCGPRAVLFRTETDAVYRWLPGAEAQVVALDIERPVAMACDPAGAQVAVAVDSTVQIWDLEPPIQRGNLRGHDEPVTHVSWSNTRIATGSLDGTVRIWRPGRAAPEIARLPGNADLRALALGGDTLWTSSRSGVQGWDLPRDGPVTGFDTHVALDGVWWSSGDALTTVDRGGYWRRVDPVSGENAARVAVLGIAPEALATRPDGKVLAVGLADGRVVAVDDEQEVLWSTPAHEARVRAVAWATPGSQLVSGAEDGSLVTLTANGDVADTLQGPDDDAVVGLSFSLDGRALLARKASGRLDRYVDGHRVQRAVDGVRLASQSRDGSVVAVQRDDGITILQADREPRHLMDLRGEALAVSPDGRAVATASQRLVQLWSVDDGHELARLVAHAKGATGVAFSPQGDTLASAGRDGHVVLWDLRALSSPPDAVVALVQSRYGTTLSQTDLVFGADP